MADGVWKGVYPLVLGRSRQLSLNIDPSKRMSFLVATNVVASRTPERQPTGTPHAHAKKPVSLGFSRKCPSIVSKY